MYAIKHGMVAYWSISNTGQNPPNSLEEGTI